MLSVVVVVDFLVILLLVDGSGKCGVECANVFTLVDSQQQPSSLSLSHCHSHPYK